MRVKDEKTKNILQSDNTLVCAEWLKNPDRYKAADPAEPEKQVFASGKKGKQKKGAETDGTE